MNAKMGYTFTNAAEGHELFIYSDISWWGISADQFRRELDATGEAPLTVRINSVGGDVFDAVAIGNLLSKRGNVTTAVDGMAASAASIIFQAGKKRKMAENAWMMIHNPSSFTDGGEKEHRTRAEALAQIREGLITTYARRSGQSREVIGDWMDNETWFTASKAKDVGFTDEITEPILVTATLDLSKFKNAPKLAIEALQSGQSQRFIGDQSRQTFMSFKDWFAKKKDAKSERELFFEASLTEIGIEPDQLVECKDPKQLCAVVEEYVKDATANATKASGDLTVKINAALKDSGLAITVDKIEELKAAVEAKVKADAAKEAVKITASRGIKPVASSADVAAGAAKLTLTEQCVAWRRERGLSTPGN